MIGQATRETRLLRSLDSMTPCKRRDRGASDQENVTALIRYLMSGRGKLRDLDDLREDNVAQQTLGLERVAGSRRMDEQLSHFKKRHLGFSRAVSHAMPTPGESL